MIPLRTGNLSAAHMKGVWHDQPLPDPERERACLETWRRAGFDAVEDYVAWGSVEPQAGRWDFSLHRDNAAAAHAAGLGYAVFLWLHVSPTWFREGPDFVPTRCARTGRAGYFPSIHAEQTWRALERFYAATGEALGRLADTVIVGFPADYGEIGHASNIARWLFPHRPGGPLHGDTFWCGEAQARVDLGTWARRRYGSRAALEQAWERPVANWLEGTAPFPLADEASSVQHRLDLAAFLTGAVTRATERLLTAARHAFPRARLELKLGHASESIALGRHLGDLVDLAARHDVLVRSTQSAMPELFSARLSSLCHRRGAAFATEGPRDLALHELRQRVFTDVAHGTCELFEYPEQHAPVAGLLARLEPAFGRGAPIQRVAVLHPTLELALKPGQGVPEALALCHDQLRRLCDLAILDDEDVARGALADIGCLVLLDGELLTAEAAVALRAWVEGGGCLILGTPQRPRACACGGDGDGGMDGDLTAWMAADSGQAGDALTGTHSAATSTTPEPTPVVRGVPPTGSLDLRPGEPWARCHLGAGWHGCDDGSWAWPEAAAPLPARWTAGRPQLVLPRPDWRIGQLVIHAALRPGSPSTPVTVLVDGQRVHDSNWPQATAEPLTIPVNLAPGPPTLLIGLELQPVRPPPWRGQHDRRELGLLVRSIALHPTDGAKSDGNPLLTRLHWSTLDAVATRIGAGRLAAGDGTPFTALMALRTWLACAPAGQQIPRDALEQLLVTQLQGGVLVHNPDRDSPHTPHLLGTRARHREPLPPLDTIWIETPEPT